MGTVVATALDEIAPITVQVCVAGLLRSDLFCTAVEQGVGTAGATASLEAPGMTWEQGRGLLGEELRIVADGVPVFTGLIFARNGTLNATDNALALSAVSYVGLMDTVYVGQDRVEEEIEFAYPRKALRDGFLDETGWNIKSIIRDIFSASEPSWRGGGGRIPAGWRAKLNLGTMSVLDRYYNRFPIGDVAFRLTSLSDALDQLLSIVGTVSFCERFTAGATYLDFFELGDASAPARRVIVARSGEHIRDVGANVLSIGRADSLDGVRTRVVGCGDRARVMISVTSNHPTCALVPAWNSAGNATVLADPDAVKKYVQALSTGTGVDLEHVFRRFRLPAAIRRLIIDEKNALFSSSGDALPIQVWKFGRDLTAEGGGNYTSAPATVPELLEGAKLDIPSGIITLSQPAINLVSSTVAAGSITDVYEPAVVGVTLTVSGARLTADSGIDGPVGVSDGLVQQIINESFVRKQVNGTVGGHAFSSCWLFDEGLGPVAIAGQQNIEDNLALLNTYTRLAQREANRDRASYSVELPFFTEGFRIGDRIEVIGEDGFDFGTHQIRSRSFNLTSDHGTVISTDNQVPLIYQNLGVQS